MDGLPSGGWHEPSDPAFGPDGLLYFANGSVSQNGVCLPQGFSVDLAKHPEASAGAVVAGLLGYALAHPGLADAAFRVVAEKWWDHILIQESLLEMGSQSILYREDA